MSPSAAPLAILLAQARAGRPVELPAVGPWDTWPLVADDAARLLSELVTAAREQTAGDVEHPRWRDVAEAVTAALGSLSSTIAEITNARDGADGLLATLAEGETPELM